MAAAPGPATQPPSAAAATTRAANMTTCNSETCEIRKEEIFPQFYRIQCCGAVKGNTFTIKNLLRQYAQWALNMVSRCFGLYAHKDHNQRVVWLENSKDP